MMGDVSMEDLSKLDENVTLATTENIFVEGEKNILEDERNIEMSNILELGEWKIPADIVEITEEGDQKKDQKEKQDKKEIAESLYDDDGAASDLEFDLGDDRESSIARLRLDLPESAKIRWDPPRGQKGTPSACIAKVSNVPVNTSQELLSTVFARAFRVKMMSDENEAEEARKAKEAGELCKNNSADETVNDEDGDKSVGEEEELVGEFNGKVYVNCSTRTGLKGLLVGYRVAVINDTLIVIAPLEEESVDIVTHRKELREKRRHEAVHGKVWTDVTEADHVSYKEDTVVSDQNEYGYSKWGRGGYGGRQDSSYGGDFSSGRPRFNDRQDRYGGFNPGRGGGRGGTWGGRPRDCDRSHDFPSLLDFSPNRHDFPSRGGRRGGYGSSEGRWNSGGSWGGYPKGGKPRGRKY